MKSFQYATFALTFFWFACQNSFADALKISNTQDGQIMENKQLPNAKKNQTTIHTPQSEQTDNRTASEIDLKLERLRLDQAWLDLKREKEKEGIYPKYIAPIAAPLIIGIITILGFFFTARYTANNITRQLTLDAEKKRDHELWNLRRETYLETIELVLKHYYASNLKEGGTEYNLSGSPPNPQEIRRTIAKLRLCTQKEGLIDAFNRALGFEGREDAPPKNIGTSPKEFVALVNIMREDLGLPVDPTPNKDFMIILFKDEKKD